jgi:hypothetical protein
LSGFELGIALSDPPGIALPPESLWQGFCDNRVRFFGTVPSPSPRAGTASASAPTPGDFASLIVTDFPALFGEFRGKRFALLWRGSRDGFGARDFHNRCDGHPNTLTLIQDTGGNIFGGFTPVKWDIGGHASGYRADPSESSFLFTLKNPHNFPAKKFGLKSEEKNKAIDCRSSYGPCFGYDIWVSNQSNANRESDSLTFGAHYVNDTGLKKSTFFTGSPYFTVKEIEVFEISE